MSKKRTNGDLSMLSHVPIQPSWLMYLEAFQSSEAKLVRASINMLCSAFYSEPCGTLPNTPEAIATAAHLSLEDAIFHFSTLTAGWKVDNKRKMITFEPMFTMARRFDSDFGDALQNLQDRAVAAISSPDLAAHELLEMQGNALADSLAGATADKAASMSDTRLLKPLPENAQITESMKGYLIDKGFDEDVFADIWEMFYSYHRSRRTTSASWENQFKTWTINQLRYGNLTPQSKDLPKVYATAQNSSSVNVTLTRSQNRPSLTRSDKLPFHRTTNFKTIQSDQLVSNTQNQLDHIRQIQAKKNRMPQDITKDC